MGVARPRFRLTITASLWLPRRCTWLYLQYLRYSREHFSDRHFVKWHRSFRCDWLDSPRSTSSHVWTPTGCRFCGYVSKGSHEIPLSYTKDFKIPLEENQICDTTLPPVNDFVGSYIIDHLDIICLDISVNTKDASRLTMVVNKQSDQAWEMWHYNYDTWCHLPDSYDDCLVQGLDRTLWSSFLISFRRDSAEKINGLFWKLDGVDVFFHRI